MVPAPGIGPPHEHASDDGSQDLSVFMPFHSQASAGHRSLRPLVHIYNLNVQGVEGGGSELSHFQMTDQFGGQSEPHEILYQTKIKGLSMGLFLVSSS